MAQAQHTVVVDRPIDEVFGYIADGSNNPRWRAGVLEIERTSGTDGQGASYRQVLAGPGGRRIRGDYQVTTYRPPNLLEFAVTAGPARPTGRFELTSTGPASTSVTFGLEYQPRGLMRLMAAMIARQMQAEVKQLDQLKVELER